MSVPGPKVRRYPGRRDELITLFDRESVETQEACGMRILGQFRDLDARTASSGCAASPPWPSAPPP